MRGLGGDVRGPDSRGFRSFSAGIGPERRAERRDGVTVDRARGRAIGHPLGVEGGSVSGTIKAGKTNLEIKDAGVAAHEMLVFKSDRKPSAYPLDKAGDIIEDGAGVDLISDGENIDSGGTQTRTLDPAPGTYLFVCNIPGHFKQGMYATVIVAP